jgi:hypothetical protein
MEKDVYEEEEEGVVGRGWVVLGYEEKKCGVEDEV